MTCHLSLVIPILLPEEEVVCLIKTLPIPHLPKVDILALNFFFLLLSTAFNKASGCYDFSRPIQIPKGWCHQGFAFIMSANLEDTAVVTGLEKVNSHPSSQEG